MLGSNRNLYKKWIITVKTILLIAFALMSVTGCSSKKTEMAGTSAGQFLENPHDENGTKETEDSLEKYLEILDNDKRPATLMEFDSNIRNCMEAHEEKILSLVGPDIDESGGGVYKMDYEGHQYYIRLTIKDADHILVVVLPLLSENDKLDLKSLDVVLSYIYCGLLPSLIEPIAEVWVWDWIKSDYESKKIMTLGKIKLEHKSGGYEFNLGYAY